MHSYTRRLTFVFTAVLCLLSLGAAGLLTAAVLSGYDRKLHHFASSNGFAAAAAAFCVLGVLVSLAFSICFRQMKTAAAPAHSTPVLFAGALVGFLLLFSFIFDIPSAETWMERIRLAMMALSAFCFLIPVLQPNSFTAARALLSLTPILYTFLSVMDVYFDSSMGMNAPLKAYYLMMYLSMALFFTVQARLALQRVKAPSYCLLAGFCVILAGAVGIPHIIFALQGYGLPLTLQESILCTAIAVYAALSLFSLREVPESTPSEEVQENA